MQKEILDIYQEVTVLINDSLEHVVPSELLGSLIALKIQTANATSLHIYGATKVGEVTIDVYKMIENLTSELKLYVLEMSIDQLKSHCAFLLQKEIIRDYYEK